MALMCALWAGLPLALGLSAVLLMPARPHGYLALLLGVTGMISAVAIQMRRKWGAWLAFGWSAAYLVLLLASKDVDDFFWSTCLVGLVMVLNFYSYAAGLPRTSPADSPDPQN
jgi:hypothetical protein